MRALNNGLRLGQSESKLIENRRDQNYRRNLRKYTRNYIPCQFIDLRPKNYEYIRMH